MFWCERYTAFQEKNIRFELHNRDFVLCKYIWYRIMHTGTSKHYWFLVAEKYEEEEHENFEILHLKSKFQNRFHLRIYFVFTQLFKMQNTNLLYKLKVRQRTLQIKFERIHNTLNCYFKAIFILSQGFIEWNTKFQTKTIRWNKIQNDLKNHAQTTVEHHF